MIKDLAAFLAIALAAAAGCVWTAELADPTLQDVVQIHNRN